MASKSVKETHVEQNQDKRSDLHQIVLGASDRLILSDGEIRNHGCVANVRGTAVALLIGEPLAVSGMRGEKYGVGRGVEEENVRTDSCEWRRKGGERKIQKIYKCEKKVADIRQDSRTK
jgi:hypothetical protein